MLAQLEDKLLAAIDAQVETADDDQLFAGGYLRGHITLAVAQAELAGERAAANVELRVQQELDSAIKAGELSPRDQQIIRDMWDELYRSVVAS